MVRFFEFFVASLVSLIAFSFAFFATVFFAILALAFVSAVVALLAVLVSAVVALFVALAAFAAFAASLGFLRFVARLALLFRICAQKPVRAAPVMSRSRAMESTPADGTRARARTNRAESSSSVEELGDATIVTRAQLHAETASRAESEVDRTMAILPHPSPPPAHRALERATAHTPPNPPPADTEVGALLSAFRQMQAAVLAETRTLAQRVAQLEQGQSAPPGAAATREVGFTRRDHSPRTRRSRRSSDSSESSQVESVSPRKRAPRPSANFEAAQSTAPPPISIPTRSTYIAPIPRTQPISTADPRADAYSYSFLENLRIAETIPTAQRNPERATERATHPATPTHSQRAENLDWDAADRETLLKAASRPRFLESTGAKIRSFLADAELFLTLCNRPRSRWAYFVLSWLGSEEAEKVRRSHVADSVADYSRFRDGLITIFGRFEFEGAFRAQLRSLRQPGAETVNAFAARTTDLCSRAYAEFATEAQLSLAVDHFIGGLADTSTRDYLLRERARRPLEWMEAVRIAQASETARLSSVPPSAAACDSTAIVSSAIAAPLSEVRDTPHGNVSSSRARSSHAPNHARSFGNQRDGVTKSNVREQTMTRQNGGANESEHASKPTQSGNAKSSAGVCFNCGKPGHLAANCASNSKKTIRCYECGGNGHLARDCANRKAQSSSQARVQSQAQTRAQPEHPNPKSSNAIASAGSGASQFFSHAEVDSIRVTDALVDTGSSFSMMSTALYEKLPSKPRIYTFENAAPDIVGVGGASAAVKGYIDVPLRIADTEVAHPLLVVDNLSFSLLIGMDILDPHAANISLGGTREVQLEARVCDVCLEPRIPAKHEFITAPAIACTVEPMSIAANSAVIVRIALPKNARNATSVAIEPLNSSAINVGCAALPAVCAPLDGYCRIAVVNPSPRAIEVLSGFPIASAKPVIQSRKDPRAAALAPRLSRDAKLRKVISELNIDALPDSAPHKSQLLALTARYLDIFAESESDVGVTDLAFHEIDTGEVRPLRQPVRRLPYGEMRAAVEHEVEKLVNADVARASTSPWASPVVMVRKKDGGWRMCVDYRRLNSVTKFDSFPLPRLDEALDAFAGATVFSSLDLAMAYHQVPVKPSDIEKTAFVTHVGLFEMSKMPFGLCNAPSTYQRLMAGVL